MGILMLEYELFLFILFPFRIGSKIYVRTLDVWTYEGPREEKIINLLLRGKNESVSAWQKYLVYLIFTPNFQTKHKKHGLSQDYLIHRYFPSDKLAMKVVMLFFLARTYILFGMEKF